MNKTVLWKFFAALAVLLFAVLFAFGWYGYLNIKKITRAEISSHATALIGQRVDIQDISFNALSGLHLRNIAIQNPDGFAAGQLVRIKEFVISPDMRALLRGSLHLTKITISSPEINLIHDAKGRLNVSEKLRQFLLQKSTRKYRVDALRIRSGSFGLDGSRRFDLSSVDLEMKGLSSRKDTRTIIKGSLIHAGTNKIMVGGWAYLKDAPRGFALTLASPGFRPASLTRSGPLSTMIMTVQLALEGDIEKDIRLSSDMTLHTRNGAPAAAHITGVIGNLKQKPSYSANIKLAGLDLSSLMVAKTFKVSGKIASGAISARGTFADMFPSLSGAVRVEGAAFKSGALELHNLNGNISFRSFGRAAAFFGESSVEASEFRYGDMRIPALKSSAGFNLARNTIVLKSLNLESKEIRCFADKATLGLSAEGNNYTADLSGVDISIPAKETGIKKGEFHISLARKNNALSGNGTFSAGNILFHDDILGPLSGSCGFDRSNFYFDSVRAALPPGTITLTGQGKVAGGPFPLKLTAAAEGLDLGKLAGLYSKFAPLPYVISGKLGKAGFDGSIEGTESLHGKAFFDAQNLTVSAKAGKRPLIKDWGLAASIDFKGKDLDFSTDAENNGVSAKASGAIQNFPETKRTAQINLSLPLTRAARLREVFWDIFPDSLLYAGLDGAVSSEIAVTAQGDKTGTEAVGTVVFKNFSLKGENDEFELGPVNGTLPFAYGGEAGRREGTPMTLFERSGFDTLSREFSRQFAGEGYNRITIGSAAYGFRLLNNITLWVRSRGTSLDIGRFSADIFGGTLNGAAFAAPGRNMTYRAGFLVKGLSLTALCNDIKPIKGYVSGKLDGIAAFKGTGPNLAGLIGKADFWTYSDKNEKTKISREFLQRISGASMRSYMTDRDFDTGKLGVYLQNGDIIFNELDISNRNFFGMKDLSITVAPYNNRISIDHLMWSLVQAAQRAKEKSP